jgi:hypothetical protein
VIFRVVIGAALLAAASRRASTQEVAVLMTGDPDDRVELERIVDATRRDSLPVRPILAKVQYGVRVAHATPARIVAAAAAIAARLAAARVALAPGASPADIAAGEAALGCGATTDALRAVRAATRGQSLATPLGVLAQLVTSGVPPKRAAEIVIELMRRGASSDQLVALGNDVDADVARGASALSALDTRMQGLTAVLAPPGLTTVPASVLTPKKP